MVGTYCTTAACALAEQPDQGFLLSGGTFATVNVPGASATQFEDINNNGVIVGSYSDSRGGLLGAAHGVVVYP